MSDQIVLCSDQIDIMRKNTVHNLAHQMYLGKVGMPRNNAEFGMMIETKVGTKEVAFPFSAFGTRKIVEAQALVKVNDAGMCYTDNHSITETELHTSYHTLIADAVQKVTKSVEDIITDAISEAHGMFRDKFVLPELFILTANVEHGKRMFNFLADHTDLDAGLIGAIRALPEMVPSGEVVLKICQTNKRVDVLAAGSREKGLLDLSKYYNITSILKFVSSFKNSNNPTQDEVLAYHKISKLNKEFC